MTHTEHENRNWAERIIRLIFDGPRTEGPALAISPDDHNAAQLEDDAPIISVFGRVRLRTLIVLRWLAVAGQTLSLLIVHYGFGFDFPFVPALGIVAASAIVNLWLSWTLPTQRFARDWEAFAQLAYDAAQLMALLALTGGLLNPFSVMLMGPMIIGVTALSQRWWISLAALVIAGSISISVWHLPLPWYNDVEINFPSLYQAGIWLALAIAVSFTAMYTWRMGAEARRMGMALAATQSVLAREQRLTAIGALAAAAAHELGTPLATVQLTAKEMAREAKDDLTREDADLIVSQAQRCRDILQRLSQTNDASDQMHDRMGLGDLIEEAAAPLRGVGAHVTIELNGEGGAPFVARRTELIYALGNFIENAVDFAATRVTVVGHWSDTDLTVTILDDGPGFTLEILSKIGEPYVTTRSGTPGQGGLGLGVFIAKTMIEKTGGTVRFENSSAAGGALVTIVWPREKVEAGPILR